MASKRKAASAPLFDQVVFAPDRDRVPGTRLVVSWDASDEAAYVQAIEQVARRKLKLERRGQDHGAWAELDLTASGIDPLQHPLDPTLAKQRWDEARPLVLPGALGQVSAEEQAGALALGERLLDGAQLATWLDEMAGELPAGLGKPYLAAPQSDKDSNKRTLAKLCMAQEGSPPLWLKSTRISDFPGDKSLRLRVSFGEEVEDDASDNPDSQRAVCRLAESLLPCARRIDLNPELTELVTSLLGDEPLFTQHIAYWNAPQGGALFHHDAFGEDHCGGQRAVIYTQISGSTAWLALSLSDLADRVEDYCEFLDEGGAEWVRKRLWPERSDFERSLARMRNRKAFEEELAQPGSGRFASLVNLGPEFTSFLADAGHAFLLGPGDALLMSSHGLRQCVMHSVFCASDQLTYGVSTAVRAAGPLAE